MGNLTHTVSGGIASFRSAARVPIESLKCHFLPKQNLHGYSKPWLGGSGKNLVNENFIIDSTINSSGEIISNPGGKISDYISVSSISYVWSGIYNGSDNMWNHRIHGYDDNKEWVEQITLVSIYKDNPNFSIVFTPNSNIKYIRLSSHKNTDEIQLEKGTVATSYEPYENICPIEGWNNITVHKTKKNLFNFDINNVEYDVPNDKGENRSVYHTGIISDGRKISVSATIIDTELTGNTTINLGYLQNGTLYQITPLIVWDTGVGHSKTVSIPIGQELLLVNAANSAWGWTRNMPRYNIQIEINDINTTFESYYNEIIPITFPNVNKNKFEVTPLSYDDWTGEGYYNSYLDKMNPIIDITNKTISITCQGSGDSILYKKTHYAPGTYTLSYDMTYSGNINTVYKRMVIMCFKNDGTMMTDADIFIPGLTWNKYYKGFFAITGTFTVPKVVDYFTICFGISNDTKGETATFSNIQLEVGSTATTYEPYSFSNTLYGGYVDVATGEIWQTIKYHTFNGEEQITDYSSGITGGKRLVSIVFDDCQSDVKYMYCDKAVVETSVQYQISHLGIRIGGGQGRFYFFVPDSMFDGEVTIDKFKQWLSENSLTATALLITPKLVGKLAPMELKTFLNYNNIQSNTNDITEATYQIHDSNMIREAKHFMMSTNNSHYKKVLWNQYAPPLESTYWQPYSNHNTASFSDGIVTSTWLDTSIGYSASIKTKTYASSIAANEVWYISYMINPGISGFAWGAEYLGGRQITSGYNIKSNQWTQCSNVNTRYQERTTQILYIVNCKESAAEVGMTAQAKAPILINLTQMFGAGNEPTTASEFEGLCKLNNIDLTTYHPLDTIGTYQTWMIPNKRTVVWNQMAPIIKEGNYSVYENPNTLTYEHGEITITYAQTNRDYHNCIKCALANKYYYKDHKYYVRQEFCPSWNSTGIGISILNMTGSVYPAATANQYTVVSQIQEKTTNSGYHNILLAYPYNESGITIGATCKVRNIFLVDLTQMFGLGNEPSTPEKFEAMCAKNNIDLNIQYPLDGGTEIPWIL